MLKQNSYFQDLPVLETSCRFTLRNSLSNNRAATMVGASQPESKASGFDTEYGVDDVVATENAELKERYATTKADDGYPKGVQLALLLLVVFVMFQVALVSPSPPRLFCHSTMYPQFYQVTR